METPLRFESRRNVIARDRFLKLLETLRQQSFAEIVAGDFVVLVGGCLRRCLGETNEIFELGGHTLELEEHVGEAERECGVESSQIIGETFGEEFLAAQNIGRLAVYALNDLLADAFYAAL